MLYESARKSWKRCQKATSDREERQKGGRLRSKLAISGSGGSCNDDLVSRGGGQLLTEASESCSSPEDIATDEPTNWHAIQIRSLSHQLFHCTKVTDKLIKPRVWYGTLSSGKSSEHDFILSSRDDNQKRGEEFHSFVDSQYLLIRTMSLVHSRMEETSNQSLQWNRSPAQRCSEHDIERINMASDKLEDEMEQVEAAEEMVLEAETSRCEVAVQWRGGRTFFQAPK